MTYKIITNEYELENFISWLPELELNETFFVCLQARKKYMVGITTNDKLQLKRFCATKRTLKRKIRQLECSIGSCTYVTSTGSPIPNDGLVLYITPNPRNMRKAAFNSIKALANLLQTDGNINPHSETLSQIHKSKSRTLFVHFDVDLDKSKNGVKSNLSIQEIQDTLIKIVGIKCFDIVKTRGGCHVLIQPNLVQCKEKNWYPIITKAINCDQSGDLMLPVVGCCQGGFTPYFYKGE